MPKPIKVREKQFSFTLPPGSIGKLANAKLVPQTPDLEVHISLKHIFNSEGLVHRILAGSHSIPEVRIRPRSSNGRGVIVFGHVYEKELIALFEGRPTVTFDPTFKHLLWLWPLARAIFDSLFQKASSRSLTFHYFKRFLEAVSPSYVVTAVDHDRNFYEVRAAQPKGSLTRFVVFQNGLRWLWELEPVKELRDVDIHFCLSESYKQALQGLTNARVEAVGTLLAQSARQVDQQEKNQQAVAVISTWRPPKLTEGKQFKSHRGSLVDFEDFYHDEMRLIPVLADALKHLGFELHILGSSSADDERVFWNNIIAGRVAHEFIARVPGSRQYQALMRYPLSITTDSTLGYEALILGQKVLFLSSRRKTDMRFEIGYPASGRKLDSRFILSEESFDKWSTQISDVRNMNTVETEEFAIQVVGQAPLNSSLGGIRNLISRTTAN